MAEKEERIYVNVYKEDPCKHCADLSGETCEFCEKRYEWDYGKKRTEAIEGMAKAICSSDGESCGECAVKNNKHACKCVLHDELFMQYAEAALNALLEVK